ncbi:MAG: hypothetical protein ACQESQ_04960 [Bacteroidota bacterium]
MERSLRNIIGARGMRPLRPSSSRNPVPNIIKSRDIPAQNNIRGTTSRGACDEGNLNNLALRKL